MGGEMSDPAGVVLLPDAGPLITLAYADALDLLFKPGWSLALVDMVLEEVTRNRTPDGQKIAEWVAAHALPVLPTATYERYRSPAAASITGARRSNLGEQAIQEVMNELARETPARTGVLLFEGHNSCEV